MDTQNPIPPNAIHHGACGQWWTGAERSHCGGCHIHASDQGGDDPEPER